MESVVCGCRLSLSPFAVRLSPFPFPIMSYFEHDFPLSLSDEETQTPLTIDTSLSSNSHQEEGAVIANEYVRKRKLAEAHSPTTSSSEESDSPGQDSLTSNFQHGVILTLSSIQELFFSNF